MLMKSEEVSAIRDIILKQRDFFSFGKTMDYGHRRYLLKKLKRLILEYEQEIGLALKKDLNKCEFESYVAEVAFVIGEIDLALKRLKKWMRPTRVASPKLQFPARSFISSIPFGTVLIIGPWNYPFHLILAPLVGAIAAGNNVVLKPSELASATSSVVARLINENFDTAEICVVEGGVKETTELLEQKFDYIFYTGSKEIGKIIMKKAAEHLTPVTLELGGKSPCIVMPDIDLKITAKRIVWGKFINAGQTCLTPDYLLVEKSIKKQLIAEIKLVIKEFFGSNSKQSPDYGRIINERHFNRLNKLIDQNQIIEGGDQDVDTLFISPTLLESSLDSKVMEEEIFGPLLPIIEVSGISEALDIIQRKERPLAIYLFSKNKRIQDLVIQETSSGGLLINDTIVHITNPLLPFGGIGPSGIGAYHGKFSFDTFSHKKSVMKRFFWLDIPLRYPPYLGKLKFVRWILNWIGY